MEHAAKPRSASQSHGPAAEPVSQARAVAGVAGSSQASIAQRKLAEAIEASPRVAGQRSRMAAMQGRSDGGAPHEGLAGSDGDTAQRMASAAVVQREFVLDQMFTANTGVLASYLEDLKGLQEMVAAIETHPLNKAMRIDIYVEGGVQDQKTKAGSTIVSVIDGEEAPLRFHEVPMVKQLIDAKDMTIKVKINVSKADYELFEENDAHDAPQTTGDMIATLLHETYLHVLPAMDHMLTLKGRHLGKGLVLDFGAEELGGSLKNLQEAMTHVMGVDRSAEQQHENSGNWFKVLGKVTEIRDQLIQGDDQQQWDLAYAIVMSAVNDVMTHTAPDPGKLGLPNLTPNMPPELKLQLFTAADKLAEAFKETYASRFPDSDSSEESESHGSNEEF
ncbi:hypothetical protein [Mitsuaria sp. 7]|uniref:hypothetical protein n=1 Tax=Mitsuaria sp. 7 TaxID=1658665 RepID=UPI0007DD0FF1|nr:hypothetical protein [Mitsuaria sp. 7]ANH67156.1 hypothetical protein ABE85_05460 [Mitsuaria sp. 7]